MRFYIAVTAFAAVLGIVLFLVAPDAVMRLIYLVAGLCFAVVSGFTAWRRHRTRKSDEGPSGN